MSAIGAVEFMLILWLHPPIIAVGRKAIASGRW
jgi:hypothetical protein